jgi:hypothetical protein
VFVFPETRRAANSFKKRHVQADTGKINPFQAESFTKAFRYALLTIDSM